MRSDAAELSLDAAETDEVLLVSAFSVKADFAEAAGSAKLSLGKERPSGTVAIDRLSCDLAAMSARPRT